MCGVVQIAKPGGLMAHPWLEIVVFQGPPMQGGLYNAKQVVLAGRESQRLRFREDAEIASVKMRLDRVIMCESVHTLLQWSLLHCAVGVLSSAELNQLARQFGDLDRAATLQFSGKRATT